MRNILITGAYGFVGKNLVARLERLEGLELIKVGSKHSAEQVKEFVAKADFIFHLAGTNRPLDPTDFDKVNKELTSQIVSHLLSLGKQVPLFLASSTQAEQNNPYGISKKGAESAVFNYAKNSGAQVYVYRLPNVFGKWCKPNYNSVIATWCYNIANDKAIEISNPDAELNLVYIDEVVDELVGILKGRKPKTVGDYCMVERTFKVTLGTIKELIYSFKISRQSLEMTDLKDDFSRFLYSTYLSHLPVDEFSYDLQMRHDNRGWLAEFIKSKNLGQIFISRTRPEITRGNHWHHTKVEKFLVIEGEAIIRFRQIAGGDSGEIIEYKVSGENLKVVDIPPGYTHSIQNTGSTDVLTLFWANEIFNPDAPDTYYLEV